MSTELESDRPCLTQSLLKGFGSFSFIVLSFLLTQIEILNIACALGWKGMAVNAQRHQIN